MADLPDQISAVKQFCDITGVSPEDARDYLNEHNWDYEAAVEACLAEQSADRDESPAGTSSARPMVINATPISTIPPNEQQQPPSCNPDPFALFLEFAPGSTPEEARHFLELSNWNVERAVDQFMDRGNSGAFDPSSAMRMVDDVYQQIRSTSDLPSSRSKGIEIREAGEGNIPPMRSSRVNPRNVQGRGQIWKAHWPDMKVWLDTISDLFEVSRGEALFRLEQSKWDWDVVIEACCKKSSPSDRTTSSPGVLPREEPVVSGPPEQDSQLKDKIISSFCETTKVTRDIAVNYLESCNWNASQAVDCFMNMTEVPSQLQIQASHGSSSSSIDADPTETGSSHKEAGEESVTVATPGIASSQVDGNDAAEEDSEMKTLKIELASGESVLLPFKLEETVRDIHTAIDRLLPEDDKRVYYLMSTDEELKDMNITVQTIVQRQGETLVQVYNDDNN